MTADSNWCAFDVHDIAQLEAHFVNGKKEVRLWTGTVYVQEMLYIQNIDTITAVVRRVPKSSTEPSAAEWVIHLDGKKTIEDRNISGNLEDAYVAGYDTLVIHDYEAIPILVVSIKRMCAVAVNSQNRVYVVKRIVNAPVTELSRAEEPCADEDAAETAPVSPTCTDEQAVCTSCDEICSEHDMLQEMGITTKTVVDPEITECPICLCPLGENTAKCVQLSKCNKHAFHVACITRVVSQRLLYCPVCRECYGHGDQPQRGIIAVRKVFRRICTDLMAAIMHIQFLFVTHRRNNRIIRGAVYEIYTPTTAPGMRALKMLETAFKHGILFTTLTDFGTMDSIVPEISPDNFRNNISDAAVLSIIEDLTKIGVKDV